MRVTERSHPAHSQPPGKEAAAPWESVQVGCIAWEQVEAPAGGAPAAGGQNGWTLVLISIGLSLIACCLLIPQADENRQQLYQCEKLKYDLEHIQKQAEINEQFIRQVNQDPALIERLAQRQLRLVRKGTVALEVPMEELAGADRSPFGLVALPAPPPMPPCPKVGGRLAEWCRDTRTRLYMMGGGLMLLATGLVLGHVPREQGPGV